MKEGEAFDVWLTSLNGPVTLGDAFKAGWEAGWKANDETFTGPVISLEAEELWGTLEGAERYLEAEDRKAFMVMKRESNLLQMTGQDPKRFQWIQDLQDRWIAYGEAWRTVQSLLPPSR